MTTKRIVVGAHYGMRDWLASASPRSRWPSHAGTPRLAGDASELSYGTGRHVRLGLMKVLTLLALIALAWHAWVGVRDIFMDYIKPIGLRRRCR